MSCSLTQREALSVFALLPVHLILFLLAADAFMFVFLIRVLCIQLQPMESDRTP